MCHLSVVVPAYNEERRLPATLSRLAAYLREQSYDWEIIVVDDGSEDRTAEAVSAIDLPQLGILRLAHCGKGAAVRQGMLAARGRYRLLCDADLAVPPDFVARLLPPHGPNAEIVIGSREAANARRFGEPPSRHLLGRVFNVLTRLLVAPAIADTQCGFKLFTARAAETLFPLQTVGGFAFDAELLFLARRLGLDVQEVGVDWHYGSGSKVRPGRDSWRMLVDVARMRWRWRNAPTASARPRAATHEPCGQGQQRCMHGGKAPVRRGSAVRD